MFAFHPRDTPPADEQLRALFPIYSRQARRHSLSADPLVRLSVQVCHHRRNRRLRFRFWLPGTESPRTHLLSKSLKWSLETNPLAFDDFQTLVRDNCKQGVPHCPERPPTLGTSTNQRQAGSTQTEH